MLPFVKPSFVKMYHLTNQENFERIRLSGSIQPFSNPYWRMRLDQGMLRLALENKGVSFVNLNKIIKNGQYVVGFNEPIPKGWIETGLMDYLLNHISTKSAMEKAKGDVFSFEMMVSPTFVFVRDHYYVSPMYFAEKYGKNYWEMFLQNPMKNIQIDQIAEGVAKYLNSTVPYNNYRNNYKCPEMWYAGLYKLPPTNGIKRLSNGAITVLRNSNP